MKLLPLVSLLVLCSARPVALLETANTDVHRCQVAAADDPPPIECPMCGGNALLHQRRTRFFVGLQASLVIWRFANSSVWR